MTLQPAPLRSSRPEAGLRPDLAVVGALLAAVAVRAWLLGTRWDVPGDGPARAWTALWMSREPSFPLGGIWPPGFSLLAAGPARLVGDALLGTRLLSLVLGSATVVLVAVVARGIAGVGAGRVAATIVALWRLHAELSATALTEAAFAFCLLLAMTLLARVREAPRLSRRRALRAGAAVALLIAETMRYEAWPVAAAWVSLEFLAGHRRLAVGLGFVLAAFPLVWSSANYWLARDALVGFRAAGSDPYNPDPGSTWFEALRHVVAVSSREGGILLWPALLVGAVAWCARAKRDGRQATSLPEVWMPAVLWILAVGLAHRRGASMYNRYLISAMIASLPIAVAGSVLALSAPPVVGSRRRLVRSLSTIWLFLLMTSSIVGPLIGPEPAERWLTTEGPEPMGEFARWRAAGPFRDSLVVATPIGWKTTYLALLDASFLGRLEIASQWRGDAELRLALESLRGKRALFLTCDADEADRRRLSSLIPEWLETARLLADFDGVRVYEVCAGADGCGDTPAGP